MSGSPRIGMVNPFRVMQRRLWLELPLRRKLALAVWLSVVPISLLASFLALREARRIVKDRLTVQLVWDAEQASEWLSLWDQQHLKTMSFMATFPLIRALQPQVTQQALVQIEKIFPNYSFLVTRVDGSPVASLGSLLSLQQDRLCRSLEGSRNCTAAKALQGIVSSTVLRPPYVSRPCVASSVPIYDRNPPAPRSIKGVITSCLAMEKLGEITGVNHLVRAATWTDVSIPMINLDQGRTRGFALLLVVDGGQALLLGDNTPRPKQAMRLLNPVQNRHGPWGPFIRLAEASHAVRDFVPIRVKGVEYFVGIDRTKPDRTALMIIDQRTAFQSVDSLFRWILLGNLIALTVSSVAIYRISGALSRPIDQTGQALARISQGDFSHDLPEESSDVGRLFSYVNLASKQLQAYLGEAKQHAITDAQLEQARRIQADFLIDRLPSTAVVQLAASFEPAYQIGADWYDALLIDSITYVVVADVCDKGIPSALYMSVFRSLLRLSLRQESQDSGDVAGTISRAISVVNRYMAETHGRTGMFATAFLAAYDPASRQLHYVLAGHELPFVLHGDQLSQLSIGGPAVGIFADAVFSPGVCRLAVGDLLMAYSDGLPDARNPAGESFGKARIAALLAEQRSEQWSAQAVVDAYRQAVQAHIGAAEQFDDLTLLCLKILA